MIRMIYSEFTTQGVIHKWLFATGAASTQTDDDQFQNGHVSCTGSKFADDRFGTAKKARLVVVKCGYTVASLMDGFEPVGKGFS